MAERGEGARTALLGAAILVLLVASVAVLVLVDFGDDSPSSPTTSASPSPGPTERSERSNTTQRSGPPQPISDACTLVSRESVASAIGAKPGDLRLQPANQALGPKCDILAPEGEDLLPGFNLQVVETNDASFARSTIEGRNGKRIADLGDVAVLEQSNVGSQISVVVGSRYVQLQTRRKAAGDDAMIDLGRQAAGKL